MFDPSYSEWPAIKASQPAKPPRQRTEPAMDVLGHIDADITTLAASSPAGSPLRSRHCSLLALNLLIDATTTERVLFRQVAVVTASIGHRKPSVSAGHVNATTHSSSKSCFCQILNSHASQTRLVMILQLFMYLHNSFVPCLSHHS